MTTDNQTLLPLLSEQTERIAQAFVRVVARAEIAETALLVAADALREYRGAYPCPRGCGTIGRCIDVTGAPARCPICGVGP